MVLVEVGIDTQRAGTWGRIIILMGLGIDTQRARDLEKIHHSGGHGDRHLEIRRPGEGSWFFWGWG